MERILILFIFAAGIYHIVDLIADFAVALIRKKGKQGGE